MSVVRQSVKKKMPATLKQNTELALSELGHSVPRPNRPSGPSQALQRSLVSQGCRIKG